MAICPLIRPRLLYSNVDVPEAFVRYRQLGVSGDARGICHRIAPGD